MCTTGRLSRRYISYHQSRILVQCVCVCEYAACVCFCYNFLSRRYFMYMLFQTEIAAFLNFSCRTRKRQYLLILCMLYKHIQGMHKRRFNSKFRGTRTHPHPPRHIAQRSQIGSKISSRFLYIMKALFISYALCKHVNPRRIWFEQWSTLIFFFFFIRYLQSVQKKKKQ